MVTWNSSEIVGYRVFGTGIGGLGTSLTSFSVAGSSDSQFPTRFQTNLTAGPEAADTVMRVNTVMTIPFTEYDDNDMGFPDSPYRRGTRIYVADAGGWPEGHVPTPAEIITGGSKGQSSVKVYKHSGESAVQVGSAWQITEGFVGPKPSDLSGATKYWIMASMVRLTVAELNAGTVRIFRPLVSGFNTTGRAVSFWTNRKPLAPVITSPSSGSVHPVGSDISLDVDFNDPDQVGSSRTPDSTGVGGVQIQYAPQPTLDAPNPTWLDMTLRSTNYTPNEQPSWSILGSTVDYQQAASLIFAPLLIRAGGNPITGATVRGYLPPGNWQIRVRTFDPGSPWNYLSSGQRPLNGENNAFTPDNYYFSLTSPWSDPIPFVIPVSTSAPQPISPVNRVAISEGTAITLVWQYRSTSDPFSPQTQRVVELRRSDEVDWTVVASGAGSASEFDIGDDLTLGLYQWRVKTTDSDGEESDFSQVAEFWVVPAPQSGGGRPDPDDSIDGATLGCGTHRAFIYRRGGKIRVGEIKGLSYLDWGRVRDDISTSKIVVRDWDIDCGNLLAKLQTWAYEIVIYRDNGYANDRVWEGPITKLTYEVDAVTIDAKDVMVYPYRRIIKQAMNDTQLGGTVTDRAMRVIQNVMAADDPNVLPYLNPIFNADDARQYRSTPAYSRTAFEEVDDMAANAGLDYTAVGRAILLWSTRHRIGTLPEFKDADFGSPPIVSEYGMSMANFYSVSDGNGIHGEASRLGADNVDEIYGLVEMLSSTWASDTQAEQGTYTQAGLQTVIASFSDFADRSISNRYPPPVVVRVPDNTTLNPDAVISIQQLVPGVVIPLRSHSTLRTVVGDQKLDSVKVVEESGSETITVTMSPFSSDDATVGGDVEA